MSHDERSLEALDALFAEIKPTAKPRPAASPEERRLVLGLEDIEAFYLREGRLPQNVEGADIFERMYAVRLQALREHTMREAWLDPADTHALLSMVEEEVDDSPSLEDLDRLFEDLDSGELQQLRFVRSSQERREPDEVAQRDPCADFERFEAIFTHVQKELKLGLRETLPFAGDTKVKQGDFFILGGQLIYVAEKEEEWQQDYGKMDARLRVIYANRTESNLLMRSLIRALERDVRGRRVSVPDSGPLFSSEWEQGDQSSGRIYVLRSKSMHPYVQEHRAYIHKIGVTGSKIETRIANARHDATYLLADVEVVRTYELANVQRHKLESLLHRFFASAQLDLEIEDRFGNKVRPREWFLLPLSAIEEAIDRIMDGSLSDYRYEPKKAGLVRVG